MLKPITIVGGGLAGLTLGVALRKQAVPVTIWEAGRYPRHRVCGEFISGRGLDVLQRLGLHRALVDNGAISACTAAFFSARNKCAENSLPQPALCLSRFKLDALLANEFRRLGGTLIEGSRWTTDFGEATVRATGRRVHAADGCRLFGLKAHARHVQLEADLEMHFQRDCYVGICRLSDQEVNVCGLFRSAEPVRAIKENWRQMLAVEKGLPLAARLDDAEFSADSFCVVAGMSLKRQSACDLQECAIGDAITMIPPLTGNGMSMAFESAEIAAAILNQYSAGRLSWAETKMAVAQACDQRFSRRLRWARWMQAILMQPALAEKALALGTRIPSLWTRLFWMTR